MVLQVSLDIMPGKMSFHREDHIAGKENVHAQHERHTEIEFVYDRMEDRLGQYR